MKDLLNTMFHKQQGDRKICTISSLLSPGLYSVSDRSGRITRAESDQFWRPGETVIVQSGRIIARTAKINNPKIYEV